MREVGLVGASSLELFAFVDFLLLCPLKGVNQPSLLKLARFRRCDLKWGIPFADLCTIVDELIHHWGDEKLFLREMRNSHVS